MQKIKNIALASWKHWREISFIYFIQLLFGLIVGLVFCSAICSSLDGSMVLDHLSQGFDRTVIMDVMNTNDGVLDSTKSVALALLGIYLMISVLLHAGWLANIKNKSYSIRSLIKNGIKFFLPFLGIAILSILLIAIYGVVIGIGFAKIVGDPLVTFSSEKPYAIWIVVLFGFFILWSIFVWSWSVTSRFYCISGKPFFTSLKLGFKTVLNRLFTYEAIGLLIIGIHVFLMLLYYCIMGDRGAPSWWIVLIGILVQQIFNFSRIVLRGFGYSCLAYLAGNKD